MTGCCGFVGFNLAKSLQKNHNGLDIIGLDNLCRRGSEFNLRNLYDLNIPFIQGDIRSASDLQNLPPVDWVIDCAANPSVLAGMDGQVSSRQLMEHNLLGTLNLLEYCKKLGAGLILLSTSRVYSARELANLPVKKSTDKLELDQDYLGQGISPRGLTENFPTSAPISLYGASKLASETLILEYGEAFGFPTWINRCGVLAGAGQFGKADQGIFSYWIHSFREKNSLQYIGFGGSGLQVRDALHPKDLVPLLVRQMQNPDRDAPKIINLGGGIENSMSLKQLSSWCEEHLGPNEVLTSEEERPMDGPWIVMDSAKAKESWEWEPATSLEEILFEISVHAEKYPDWLKSCN
ncbi:MAG: NAD-dependent epimerase/dehydratase family protein [Verrucomicrobiota bacterium]|nr:NAD-dependent epimerase/dehydratase family protein [Verrucomicrobiota bacterium]